MNGYKRGWIEAPPVVRVLKQWLKEQGEKPATINGFSTGVRELTGLGQLASWTGIPHDTLYAYTSKRKVWMPFDTADKIICHTYGPMLWRSDPELMECYQGMDLAYLDESLPTTRAA